jgi:hypothetical protein
MADDVTDKINDDATDRRLLLLVGLIVVGGLINLTWAVDRAIATRSAISPYLLLIILLCITGYASNFRFRVRGDNFRISMGSPAVLVAAVATPIQWTILCVTMAVLIVSVVGRFPPLKASFNVAKEGLAAAAAAAAVIALHLAAVQPMQLSGAFGERAAVLLVAAVVYTLVDEGLFLPVIALSTGT